MPWTVYNSDGKVLQSAELGDNAVTSAKIADGAIVNADVNASAAVALTKLAATTVSRALVSDGSGVISPSAVTSTEIGYLDGVTSAIQTQINAAGGAVTREGGDATETTTTSTSAVDLLAASSLTIGATEPFLQMHNGRKTSGAANYTPCGYKMNSTTIGEATGSNVRGWYSSGTNQAEDGGAWAIMGPRVTNYQAFARGLRSAHYNGANAVGMNGTAAHLSQLTQDTVMPIATVTDFVIRGLTLNASNTLGADELQLYSYAAA
tara:strand:+ start:132 stop:923 length:792 start_codon:yes stop_codon:yes gene_type:complete